MDFNSIFRTENVKPQVQVVDIPMIPIQLACAMAGQDHLAFLDSSCESRTQGRFSIIAWEPKLVFSSKGRKINLRFNGQWTAEKRNPFKVLESIFSAAKVGKPLPDGIPFAGGAIGFLGYDLFTHIEKYENLKSVDDLDLPDCTLAFYDWALIYDHDNSRWVFTGVDIFEKAPPFGARAAAVMEQAGKCDCDREMKFQPTRAGKSDTLNGPPRSDFSRDGYMAAVAKAKEHIFAGDIYQINLSQRFHAKLSAPPLDLFQVLRTINPSFYGAYLPYEKHTVISSSPELYLGCRNGVVETRPIKGTRPRSENEDEDHHLKNELKKSPKDTAELSMIVDLERNDLGRVCEYGTVKVKEHRYIEPLPTVFHTISTVTGRLHESVGPVDLLKATFPGGSITGCPKIRSIQIIDELEPTRRNVYTGSIGYIGFNGDMVLNIAIRTLVAKGKDVYFQVGGGIVADSDPEAEYNETLDKAQAMLRAIKAVEDSNV